MDLLKNTLFIDSMEMAGNRMVGNKQWLAESIQTLEM